MTKIRPLNSRWWSIVQRPIRCSISIDWTICLGRKRKALHQTSARGFEVDACNVWNEFLPNSMTLWSDTSELHSHGMGYVHGLHLHTNLTRAGKPLVKVTDILSTNLLLRGMDTNQRSIVTLPDTTPSFSHHTEYQRCLTIDRPLNMSPETKCCAVNPSKPALLKQTNWSSFQRWSASHKRIAHQILPELCNWCSDQASKPQFDAPYKWKLKLILTGSFASEPTYALESLSSTVPETCIRIYRPNRTVTSLEWHIVEELNDLRLSCSLLGVGDRSPSGGGSSL